MYSTISKLVVGMSEFEDLGFVKGRFITVGSCESLPMSMGDEEQALLEML